MRVIATETIGVLGLMITIVPPLLSQSVQADAPLPGLTLVQTHLFAAVTSSDF
jgi:hypothetical protein